MDLEQKAAVDGIDTYVSTRTALIELRNKKLNENNFEEAVLLSHVTWWMSVLGTPEARFGQTTGEKDDTSEG